MTDYEARLVDPVVLLKRPLSKPLVGDGPHVIVAGPHALDRDTLAD
jgi:hypothetical protein